VRGAFGREFDPAKCVSPETLAEVEAFLNAPLEWSARNGGISELKK
jgi:hypothetical protein